MSHDCTSCDGRGYGFRGSQRVACWACEGWGRVDDGKEDTVRRYVGTRALGNCAVTVHEDGSSHNLEPRTDIINYSGLFGFGWGYNGAGTDQLALAILADCMDDDTLAQEFHQRFKIDILLPIKDDNFVLSSHDIDTWVRKARRGT
jgi:hypothetical protein